MKEAALAIVPGKDESVLLVMRKDVPVWVLPGGGIEEKERPEEAAIRETLEESGLSVLINHKVATYLPVNRMASKTHLFVCEAPSSCEGIVKETEEISDVRFFPLNALPPTLFPLHRTFLSEWKSCKGYPFTRPLLELNYLSLLRLFCCHPLLSIRYLWTRFRKTL